MTVRAKKFTPEVLLSAPRRSAAVPNADGTLALFSVSTYSFESHSKTSEIRVLDVKNGQSKVLTDDLGASEPTWLGEQNLVLWLKGGEKGTTSLVMADAENFENKYFVFNMYSLDSLLTFSGQKSLPLSMAEFPTSKLLGSIRTLLLLCWVVWLHQVETSIIQRLHQNLILQLRYTRSSSFVNGMPISLRTKAPCGTQLWRSRRAYTIWLWHHYATQYHVH